jgi:hypothetical protein
LLSLRAGCIAADCLAKEDAVAKGQQRSNREKKKPKQDKKKVAPPPTPIGSTGGKPGQGPKKG